MVSRLVTLSEGCSPPYRTFCSLTDCLPTAARLWLAVQLLEGACPSAKLCHVVEPWFMGPGATGPGGPEFTTFAQQAAKDHGVQFHKSVADVPSLSDGVKRLALISGRTADNPKYLTEAINAGCTTIYLEKPGAPTVAELEVMMSTASTHGVTVLMGYNKNVAKYVASVRRHAADVPGSHVTFVTNNAYENTPESLGECFERNAEGMLKNMAIHELALLVSFYDVTVDTIASVDADQSFSSMQTLSGPTGKDYTDFDKIKFTIKTRTGKSVTVQADRCGGDTSYAFVSDAEGNEVYRHYMPDEDDKKMVEQLKAKYPGAMPYFFPQHLDYITVKERVAKQCATGEPADGIATIEIAVDTLKVAEYLTPELKKQLL